MKISPKKILIYLFSTVFITNFLTPLSVYALSPEQKSLYDQGVNYYDIETNCNFDRSLPNNSTNNKVYIMGDSYSVGIDATLTKDLNSANYDVVGKNEDNAGTISSNGDGEGTPAIDALDKDKAKIAEAGSMTILLGTNRDDYENDIPKFMDKLKNINTDIKVYWMTIGYRIPSDAQLKERNDVITTNAKKYGYEIVDWFSVYQNNKSLIKGDDIHPTTEGYQKLSKLFIDAMGKYNPDNSSSTSPSNKFMNTNKNQPPKKRVWTFLTSPDGLGLTAVQAAAVMGNFQQESGINPKAGSLGSAYGLGQWQGSRLTSMQAYADRKGKDISDLDLQLNNVKRELLSNDFNFMFKLLKKQTDIIKATVIFHGSSGVGSFTVPELEGNRGFESSGDSLSFIKEVRGGYAKGFYKEFTGTDPGSLAPDQNNGSNDQCLCSSKTTNQPVIFLDPGHSGKDINGIDPITGIRDHDYPNIPEIDDAWDVAQTVKKDLEKDGYKVVLSKDSARETSNFRTKSSKADSAKADLAISIHTDPGLPNTGWITIPKVGQYRTAENGNKVEYKDSSAADISKKDAEIFKTARQKNEGNDIIMKDISLEGRPGLAPGNIPLIMLMSKTPWVYLEKKSGNGGLSSDKKKDYAESIKDGVKASLPLEDATSTSVGDCSGTNPNSGSIVDKILEYAWEDGRDVQSPAKPQYVKDTKIAADQGKYTGAYAEKGLFTDCGAFVTRVMQNTVDPKYGGGSFTYYQEQYLKEHKEKYTALGPQKDTTKLQPGDIAIVNKGGGLGGDGHTFFYTGKINKEWKGNGASASGYDYVPRANNVYFIDPLGRGQYLWFRYK